MKNMKTRGLIKKGYWYYEIQILMWVFMWQHDMNNHYAAKTGFRWGRLYIWYDSSWKSQGFPARARHFWCSLTRHVEKFDNRKDKLFVLYVNARHMFKCWLSEKTWFQWLVVIFDNLKSILNYLRLHRAGFRITRSVSFDGHSEINRFWWDKKIIEDSCDIDRSGDVWASMAKGRANRLSSPENKK